MSDISDVESALLSLLTQTAYPNGTSNSSAVADDKGKSRNVKLFRGWPVPALIDNDMQVGTVDVSIFPMAVEQNVTRYGLYEDPLPKPAATITVTPAPIAGGELQLEGGGSLLLEDGSGALLLDGNGIALTIAGTVTTPQNVAAIVNGIGYSYGVQKNDTLATIATGLAALINVDTPATSSGAVISIPTAFSINPRVGVVGTAVREVSRQKRNVVMTLWCPSPDVRDNAAKLFDPTLKSTNFLNMIDGAKCRLTYMSSPVIDTIQKEACYRRDLIYACEFGTTVPVDAPEIIVEQIKFSTDPTLIKTVTL